MNDLIKRRVVIEFHQHVGLPQLDCSLMSWSSYLQFCDKPCFSYLPSPSVYHSDSENDLFKEQTFHRFPVSLQINSKLFMVADKTFYDLASVYFLSLPPASSIYLAGFASGVLSGWTHPVAFI